MKELLEAVRKVCLPGIWSQGVKLAREGLVVRGAVNEGEVTLRVRGPGHAVAPTVTLYTDEIEWVCDCGGKVDPCAHVAAAVIALPDLGQVVASAGDPGSPRVVTLHVGYRLGKRDRTLAIVRKVVDADGREEALVEGLVSSVARGRLPQGLDPTHEDLEIDRLLVPSSREGVPLPALRPLFSALSSASDVTFEGKPVKISSEAIGPRAIIEDGPAGAFVLRMERDPRVDDVPARGVVRSGDALHPMALGETTGYLLERLPASRTFNREAQAELVNDVLPELDRKLDLVVKTSRLPKSGAKALPRIDFDLSHAGHTLSVLPTLVYGDPAIARVDGDDLVLLGGEVPVRKRDLERELLTRLRENLHLGPGRRLDLDGSEATRFAAKVRDFQRKEGEGHKARIFDGRPLVPRLELADGRFDVVFETAGDGGDGAPPARAGAGAVLAAWRDKLDLVPLDGGGWAPLPAGFLELHGHRVLSLLAARDQDHKLPRAALPELGELCQALDLPKPPELGRLAPLLEGFTGIPPAKLPEGLHATLRPYQQKGVDWLCFLRDVELGAVLADDMGLGKTLETIAALRGRVLVVCPKSVVHNWAHELARFRPSLRTALYHGPGRVLDRKADVTLATYAVLRLDAIPLADEDWDVVVLDEAQAIKNAESQTAQAAFGLRARFRVALSGTPVENRLEELWSLMHFANPGLLGGRSAFSSGVAAPIAAGEAGAAQRLRTRIQPFVLRRTKKDVVPELPPRTDMVQYVELDESERAIYDSVRAATRKEVTDQLAEGHGTLAVLEALLRLRQAACHPALLPGQSGPLTSSKVERLVLSLEDAAADGHKALVFSQWTSFLDLIEPALEAASVRFTRLDGSTRDRESVVKDFQSEAGPPVLLVSLKAGGTGLNLTAADHVFLMDPWWNPAVEDQAADRAHRIGQDRPVLVYRMVATGTVEERLLSLQTKKRALADAALAGADQASGITRDELLALLD